MRSRKAKAFRLNLGDDDDNDNKDDELKSTGGDEGSKPSSGKDAVSLRKRQSVDTKKKKPIKTSIEQNDIENEEEDGNDPVVLKRNRRPKGSWASSQPISTGGSSVPSATSYTKEDLDALKASTKERPLKEQDQTTNTPPNQAVENFEADTEDYIAIDEEEKSLKQSNYDIEEGAGFEDERLAIGQRDEKAQLLRHRKEMEDAINETVTDEEDENEWENSQIQKAVGNKNELPPSTTSNNEVDLSTVDQPIPNISQVLEGLKDILSDMESQKNDNSERLEELKSELDRIDDRETQIQQSLDKAASDYKTAEEGINQKTAITDNDTT